MNSTAAKQQEAQNNPFYEIQKAKEDGANLLIPFTKMDENPFYRPVVDYVFLSADPADKDVYLQKSKDYKNKRNPKPNPADEFILTYQAKAKLAVCAGMQWNSHETKRTDDRKDPFYISFQAVGGVPKADGTINWLVGHYDLDFKILEEELTQQYWDKANSYDNLKSKPEKDREAYVNYCVKRDMTFKRKHGMKLCESGAKGRVIMAALGLRAMYTRQQLSKPFVMVRYVFKPDYSDPEIKRMIMMSHLQATCGIFGPGPQSSFPTPIDVTPPDVPANDGDDPTVGPDDADIPQGGDAEPTEREIFEGYSEEDQAAYLTQLAERKGYDLSGLPKQPAEMDARNRLRFFDHLSAIPAMEPAKEKEDDDVPF